MEKIKWRYIKMRYIYNVRKDILKIDEGNHTVYGIDVIHNSAVVKSAGNLFCDRETAESFAKLCGSENLSPEKIEPAAAEILDSPEKSFRFTDMCG